MFARLFRKTGPTPLYYLIAPRSAEVLGPWAKCFPQHKEVVGYSSLGHFFMREPEANEYIVLHPFEGAAKSYGTHQTVEEFESNVLKEPGFEEYVLRPEHVRTIAKGLGALLPGQIYIPQPYPFMGGSDAPETYGKGDVWVFSHIVAQMGGL